MPFHASTPPILLLDLLWCVFLFSAIAAVSARTAQENLDAMTGLTQEFGALIKGSDEIFKKYVKSKHSKYSVIVLFNALDKKYNCEVCQEAKDEFEIAAYSYSATESEQRLFFVVFDYDYAPNAFHSMQLTHAPEFMIFPSKQKKKKKYETYDVMRNGLDAKGMLRWIHETTRVKISVKRPIPWRILIVGGTAALLVLLLVMLKPKLCVAVLTNSSLWGALLLFIVLAMTSGQMWNSIRNPPNLGHRRDGKMRLIMENESAQFRYESYVIILLNGVISIGFILLNLTVDIKQAILRKVIGFCGLCLVFVVFGYLVSVFRMKNSGYPYYLIFE